MSLKLIIDADTVIQRLALKDIQEVRDSIESALTAAHAVVQGFLTTTFDKEVHTDVFFLQKDRFPLKGSNLIACRLKQAFVWGDTVQVDVNADSRRDLLLRPTLLEAEDFIVDTTRGLIQIEGDYLDYWVQVTYTAGFDKDHAAPDWLQEAVLAYMPHLLGQPTGAFDAAAMNAANETAKMDYTVAAKIVEPYLRNHGMQYTPITSS